MKGFVKDIEKATLENSDYRRVLFTGRNTQLVLMAIAPGDEIGLETHDEHDQFIRVESGAGTVVMDGEQHNLADGISAARFRSLAPVWTLLHQVGVFGLAGWTFIVGYPLVPWVAVMGLGFVLGPLFQMAPGRRQAASSRTCMCAPLESVVTRDSGGIRTARASSSAEPIRREVARAEVCRRERRRSVL